ncbi:(d)CMP kinase [Nonomuraea gerenzanensis]|uniref:Cytidylate kinase n=1 Tax=Nonomuraea gerenzanensis TaxID=93944 RepID=A0A1M4E7D6_9ACTN|nr:(d)CMP kinase [Nonomuraea gerenzanensis]UBU17049.1 (d)CMP kinase [Nonomuraea gerenzanensis]SBO94781.1 Cytidylate kinase [Nonomuraea gerenzanensis]
MTGLVVAMDGPSGSGKSSVSRGAARALGLRYLDTGAMYRAMTWWVLQQGIDPADHATVAARCGEPAIVSGTDPDAPAIHVDGVDVAGPIRQAEVTGAVSAVAAVPEVRARLVALQREIIGTGDIVVEGRDIGSAVWPEAPVKIYLTASAEARARRRSAEVAGSTVEAQQEAMARRDTLDSTRKTDPLSMAVGAIELDTTALTLDEVVAEVLRLVAERRSSGGEREGRADESRSGRDHIRERT